MFVARLGLLEDSCYFGEWMNSDRINELLFWNGEELGRLACITFYLFSLNFHASTIIQHRWSTNISVKNNNKYEMNI